MKKQKKKQRKILIDKEKMANKNKSKYVTISEGVDFRTIAKIMSKHGYKMNHATARNVLISAMRRIMHYAATEVGASISDEHLETLIKNQDIHMALGDVLLQAYSEQEVCSASSSSAPISKTVHFANEVDILEEEDIK